MQQKDSWQPTPSWSTSLVAESTSASWQVEETAQMVDRPIQSGETDFRCNLPNQNVENRSVVHFNTCHAQTRLKGGSRSTLFQPTELQASELTEPQEPQQPNIQFGTHLEIVEDSDPDKQRYPYRNRVQFSSVAYPRLE